MKSVLITGANGYIGSQVLAQLASQDIPITALSHRPFQSKIFTKYIRWEQINLLDSRHLNAIVEKSKASHLIHLAWCTQPGQYWQSEENYQWIEASMELVKCFIQSGGEHVLVAGSCAEYDWTSGYYNEKQTPLDQSSAYASSKNELHFLLRSYLNQQKIPLTWARLFFSFGPGEAPQKLCSSIAYKLLSGEIAECQSGWQLRDYLYVKDLASAVCHLSQISANDVYNIGSGQGVQIRDLVLELEKVLQQRNRIIFSPKPKHGPGHASVVADISALATTGWSPVYTLQRALAETVLWWKSNARNITR